jgi:hypothetical protein
MALGTSATVWLAVPAPDGALWWVWSSRWNKWKGKPKYPVPFCPPQILYHLTWALTRASAVGSRHGQTVTGLRMRHPAVWDLWWAKCDCSRFLSEYFILPCQFLLLSLILIIYHSVNWSAIIYHSVNWSAIVYRSVNWSAIIFHSVNWSAIVHHSVDWSAIVYLSVNRSAIIYHSVNWSAIVYHSVNSLQSFISLWIDLRSFITLWTDLLSFITLWTDLLSFVTLWTDLQ